MHQPAPLPTKREALDDIALVALEFGRLIMESGGTGRSVEETTEGVAKGLGVERVDVRVGYASLSITIGAGSHAITRMRQIGSLGVNQKLLQALSLLSAEAEKGKSSAAELRCRLDQVVRDCHPYSEWVVAIAVGLACAAFGRLLDIDWAGVGPVFFASVLAQFIRRRLGLYKLNVFLTTTVVAFVGATLSGIGARLTGSQTVARDMVTTVLLLVPGVPAFNAQLDILDGRPTLGSARTVWVLTILVFMSAGVWLAIGLLGEAR